jgi:hypothetical protein
MQIKNSLNIIFLCITLFNATLLLSAFNSDSDSDSDCAIISTNPRNLPAPLAFDPYRQKKVPVDGRDNCTVYDYCLRKAETSLYNKAVLACEAGQVGQDAESADEIICCLNDASEGFAPEGYEIDQKITKEQQQLSASVNSLLSQHRLIHECSADYFTPEQVQELAVTTALLQRKLFNPVKAGNILSYLLPFLKPTISQLYKIECVTFRHGSHIPAQQTYYPVERMALKGSFHKTLDVTLPTQNGRIRIIDVDHNHSHGISTNRSLEPVDGRLCRYQITYNPSSAVVYAGLCESAKTFLEDTPYVTPTRTPKNNG